MNNRLQDISFRVSRYFRPLEKWHCGGMEDGHQCSLGPDKNGHCRAIKDCTPDKEGNTWTCTRSQLLGGKCKSGPSNHGGCGRQRPPCKPVRNLRARRQGFAWVIMSVVLAAIFVGLSYDFWRTPVSPGPLSQHHMAFGTDNCVACHSAAELPRSNWLGSIFSGHGASADSAKCVSCHSIGEEAENPHSLNDASLAALTQKMLDNPLEAPAGGSLLVSFAKGVRGSELQSPACTSCHFEHKGVEGETTEITEVSDQQCAVCHTNSFDDFKDHPDFTHYPAEARTQIIFSHNSHLNKHFLDEENTDVAPTQCLDCHKTDAIGRQMEVTSFAAACSSCHSSQIDGDSRSSAKGFAMLSFPYVDTDTLEERGIDIGEWPGGTDAELTSLNLLLIAATDSNLASELSRLSALDLYDLTQASDEDLELVYQAMWTLKRTYLEMQRGGAQIILDRLSSVLPSDAERPQEIIGLLSPGLIDTAVNLAFPNLDSEVTRWLKDGLPAFNLKAVTEPEPEPEVVAASSASSTDEDDDWLSSATTDSADDDDWLSSASDDDSSDSLEDDDWLSGAADSEADDDDWLNDASADEDSTGDDDDWLSGATGDDDGDDWLEDLSNDESTSLDDDDDIQVEALSTDDGGATEIPEQLSLEDRAAAGGWYFEDYYLRYRPSGHADRLIVAWVDLLVSKANSNSELSALMMRSVLSKDTPGSCMKCHSVDTVQGDKGVVSKVNWFGEKTKPSHNSFNRFRHSSHFAVISQANESSDQANGCASCHVIDPESDSGIAYESDANGAFQSDFAVLDKAECATCHVPETELASCTQCHNFHIGEQNLIGVGDGFGSALRGAKTAVAEESVDAAPDD